MRLWTLHPKHLDPAGLVAVWREALLAQAVLHGKTRGYRAHPQLVRFRARPDPRAAISCYLHAIAAEATRRGYRFDDGLILARPETGRIRETAGQLAYEWSHLGSKLQGRNRAWYEAHHVGEVAVAHPLFRIVAGPVRGWERVVSDRAGEAAAGHGRSLNVDSKGS